MTNLRGRSMSSKEDELGPIAQQRVASDRISHGATMYDLIGDIHGCATALKALLTTMGYRERDGVWQHPTRQVIFLGDFIDRGPAAGRGDGDRSRDGRRRAGARRHGQSRIQRRGLGDADLDGFGCAFATPYRGQSQTARDVSRSGRRGQSAAPSADRLVSRPAALARSAGSACRARLLASAVRSRS